MAAVYVVRTEDKGKPILGVFDELRAGRARIGWSYEDALDLRLIGEAAKQGRELSKAEHKAKRCMGFLTRPVRNDYLLYPIINQNGECSVLFKSPAVTGTHPLQRASIATSGHIGFASLITIKPIDLKDDIVSSQLRYRLGKQGRFSKVYDPAPFFSNSWGILRNQEDRCQMARIKPGFGRYIVNSGRVFPMPSVGSSAATIYPGISVVNFLNAWGTRLRCRKALLKPDRMSLSRYPILSYTRRLISESAYRSSLMKERFKNRRYGVSWSSY